MNFFNDLWHAIQQVTPIVAVVGAFVAGHNKGKLGTIAGELAAGAKQLTALSQTADSHDNQLTTLAGKVGEAGANAQNAVSSAANAVTVAAQKAAGPDLSPLVTPLIEEGKVALQAEVARLVSEAQARIAATPLAVNVTQGLKLSDLADGHAAIEAQKAAPDTGGLLAQAKAVIGGVLGQAPPEGQ